MTEYIYELITTNTFAKGVETTTNNQGGRKILVFAGAKTVSIEKNWTNTRENGKSPEIFKELVEKGVLELQSDGSYLLVEDTEFNSKTQAADIFNRRNQGNANKIWVHTGEEFDPSSKYSGSKPSSNEGVERPQRLERDGWVRNRKVANAAKKRENYTCQTCGLKFEDTYGEIGRGFLEAHHLFPVSKREKEETQITADEIAALCSNCHRMIHRLLSRDEATEESQLETLKSIIEEHKP